MHDPTPTGAPLEADLLQDAASTFGMLAATARLQIMWLLSAEERDVGTLADELGQTVAGVSQHLAKLRLAGLVKSRRAGRRHIYLIDDPHVIEIIQLAVTHHRATQRRPTMREIS